MVLIEIDLLPNLTLFEAMKNGDYEGSHVLRAK
jgi:hypothetical protein